MINAKLELYEKSFSVKDKQDLLAMCIINFATEITRKQNNIQEYENIALQLKDTEQYLNTYLSKVVLWGNNAVIIFTANYIDKIYVNIAYPHAVQIVRFLNSTIKKIREKLQNSKSQAPTLRCIILW